MNKLMRKIFGKKRVTTFGHNFIVPTRMVKEADAVKNYRPSKDPVRVARLKPSEYLRVNVNVPGKIHLVVILLLAFLALDYLPKTGSLNGNTPGWNRALSVSYRKNIDSTTGPLLFTWLTGDGLTRLPATGKDQKGLMSFGSSNIDHSTVDSLKTGRPAKGIKTNIFGIWQYIREFADVVLSQTKRIGRGAASVALYINDINCRSGYQLARILRDFAVNLKEPYVAAAKVAQPLLHEQKQQVAAFAKGWREGVAGQAKSNPAGRVLGASAPASSALNMGLKDYKSSLSLAISVFTDGVSGWFAPFEGREYAIESNERLLGTAEKGQSVVYGKSSEIFIGIRSALSRAGDNGLFRLPVPLPGI